MTTRPSLDHFGLSAGENKRLHRILCRHGLGNGTAIFLPYDQGLEHGPRDFFANPAASDPQYVNFPGPEKQSGVPPEYQANVGPHDDRRGSPGRPAARFCWFRRRAPETRPCSRTPGSRWRRAPPGLILGGNVWQRDPPESLRLVGHLRQILARYLS